MKESDTAAERPFVDRFDCCFPYEDPPAASGLIREGFEISLNAAFGVLAEISGPPPLEGIPLPRLLELLNEWCEVRGLDFHPLAEPVSRFAATAISERNAPIEECLSLMTIIGQYPGQYGALNVVNMASDYDDEESQFRLEALDREIRDRWARAGF
jgi:hypothetical protein